jgi:hypothetical protein
MVCLPAIYSLVVPGIEDIYASMHKVDTIYSPMVLVYDSQENLKK